MDNSLSTDILILSKSVFERISHESNLFVVPFALIRVAYSNVTGGGEASYSEVLKGVILYFILIFGFEPVLSLILSISPEFAPHTTAKEFVVGDPAQIAAGIPLPMRWGLESSTILFYYIADFLHVALTVLMSALAPLVFLFGAIFNVGMGVRAFFGLFVFVGCWPLVYGACDGLEKVLIPHSGFGVGALVFTALIMLIKILGPVAVGLLAMGSHAGQALATIVMPARSAALAGARTFVKSESVRKSAQSLVSRTQAAGGRLARATKQTAMLPIERMRNNSPK